MSETVKLRSSDGKLYEVSRETAMQMDTVRNLIESLEGGDDETIVPVPQVKGRILLPILQWCEYHRHDEIFKKNQLVPVSNAINANVPQIQNIPEIDDPFDKEFINVPNDQLFDYILAANFLAIEHLLDFMCKAVSNMMKGKTAKQIREMFQLNEDNVKFEKDDTVHAAKRVAKNKE